MFRLTGNVNHTRSPLIYNSIPYHTAFSRPSQHSTTLQRAISVTLTLRHHAVRHIGLPRPTQRPSKTRNSRVHPDTRLFWQPSGDVPRVQLTHRGYPMPVQLAPEQSSVVCDTIPRSHGGTSDELARQRQAEHRSDRQSGLLAVRRTTAFPGRPWGRWRLPSKDERECPGEAESLPGVILGHRRRG